MDEWYEQGEGSMDEGCEEPVEGFGDEANEARRVLGKKIAEKKG